MAQDAAFSRIPVEIWRDIFDIISLDNPKYEFSLEGTAYILVDRDSGSSSGILTIEEESEVIRRRLCITKVCRYWYGIGVQALWSHVRIRLDDNTFSAIDGVNRAIERDLNLALSIIRLTFRPTGIETTNELVNSCLRVLIRNLPSIEILVCPREYGIGWDKRSLDTTVLHGAQESTAPRNIIAKGALFHNVRTLSIDLQDHHNTSHRWEKICFPRLENLGLQVNDVSTSYAITRYWKLPRLRILSIRANITRPWLDLLDQWGQELHTLELILFDSSWPREIHLPTLKKLTFSVRQTIRWKITAPRLETFAIFDLNGRMVPNIRETLNYNVAYVQTTFPSFRRLRIIGSKGIPFISSYEPGGLTQEDIETWRKDGIELDIWSDTNRKEDE